MATQSPSDFEFNNISVAARPKSSGVKVQAVLWSDPNYANDVTVYVRAKDGKWIYLNDFIEDITWSDSLESGGITSTMTLVNSPTENGQRIANYVGKGSKIMLFFKMPYNDKTEEIVRMTVWDRKRSSSADAQTLVITCYDQMKHIIESKATFLFRNRGRKWSANEMTKRICKSQGIPIRQLPKSKNNIRYFYAEAESVFDTLVRIWTLEARESGRKFRIRMVKGKLSVSVKPKRPKSKVLEVTADRSTGILVASSHMDSLDGVYTSIRLHGFAKDASEDEQRNSSVISNPYKNKNAVASYGRIHYEEHIPGVTSRAKLNKLAKQKLGKLSKITRTAEVEMIGMPFLLAGSAIRLTDKATGLAGVWYFKSVDHSINGDGEYVTSGQLVNYDFTLTLDTDESNLKPPAAESNNDQDGTFVFDPASQQPLSAPLGSHTMPRQIAYYIEMAATANGPSGRNYPPEWANDPALAALLQSESSFNWTAQNPTSTAFGLFQFLDQTWAGTGVGKSDASPPTARSPYQRKRPIPGKNNSADSWRFWMCYAGLVYIQQRYGTPQRAYAHWLAQSPHWY